ncbi:ABC transporter substrate-binding protein [Geomicrobium sediminis]|uniref:Peptide/nickel transport system substrate-binding protein n=1 Tax=Geomicrobium sediminis TaxID=1347788 RepID=A0ABS2PI83_9BACL|nr:ABC transporter substrate-binding protein [Geomicrobium sediminis]MBM7634735.1 peptide/nickel transport system substrate-binding protein [Geomicrobium sediminis]
MKTYFSTKGLFVVSTLVLLTACGNDEPQDTTEAEHTSSPDATSELRVAFNAQPPSLDPYITTAVATRDIARHIYEGLVTFDENYEIQPWLAESYDVSDDGTSYTFTLREDVSFHNGETMTSDDVVASMERWFTTAANAKEEFSDATISAVDEHTVLLELEEPSAVAITTLASPDEIAAITPADLAESASADGISEHIGTGPYKLENWQHDQHIHLSRFEDYENPEQTSTGLASLREAHASDIYFEFVTDPSTRVAGMQSNQYDVANAIPFDNVEQLEQDANVVNHADQNGFNALIFNKEQGVFSDQAIRQAANTALNMEAIQQAAFTNEEYYKISHDFMTEDRADWYTEVGSEYYNQNDSELAQQLLEESAYNGEEVVILTSRDYDDHYSAAVVIQQELEAIGMNVTLDLYDWPTVLERRADPTAHDAFVTGFQTPASPTQYVFLESSAGWPGWTNSEEIDQHVDNIRTAVDQDEAMRYYEDLQEEIWTYLPLIRFGDKTTITTVRENVDGYDFQQGLILWNTHVTE